MDKRMAGVTDGSKVYEKAYSMACVLVAASVDLRAYGMADLKAELKVEW